MREHTSVTDRLWQCPVSQAKKKSSLMEKCRAIHPFSDLEIAKELSRRPSELVPSPSLRNGGHAPPGGGFFSDTNDSSTQICLS